MKTLDLEGEEVAKVTTPRLLQPSENAVGRAKHSQIDVLRRASALEAKFKDEAALERCRFA